MHDLCLPLCCLVNIAVDRKINNSLMCQVKLQSSTGMIVLLALAWNTVLREYFLSSAVNDRW